MADGPARRGSSAPCYRAFASALCCLLYAALPRYHSLLAASRCIFALADGGGLYPSFCALPPSASRSPFCACLMRWNRQRAATHDSLHPLTAHMLQDTSGTMACLTTYTLFLPTSVLLARLTLAQRASPLTTLPYERGALWAFPCPAAFPAPRGTLLLERDGACSSVLLGFRLPRAALEPFWLNAVVNLSLCMVLSSLFLFCAKRPAAFVYARLVC